MNTATYITHKPPESKLVRARERQKETDSGEKRRGVLIASIDFSIGSPQTYTFFRVPQ